MTVEIGEQAMIALGIFLALQTGGLIWSLATIKGEIKNLCREFKEFKHGFRDSERRQDSFSERLSKLEAWCEKLKNGYKAR